MAIVNIKDSLNRFSVYYASEDVFDVKFTGDTLCHKPAQRYRVLWYIIYAAPVL